MGNSYANQQQEDIIELCNLPSDPEGSVAAFWISHPLLETIPPGHGGGAAPVTTPLAPIFVALQG